VRRGGIFDLEWESKLKKILRNVSAISSVLTHETGIKVPNNNLQ
jgi:hypothetical protein